MRGAVAADGDGTLGAFVQAGLTAIWENGRDMSNPDVFVAECDAAGFDGDRLLARTQEQPVKDALVDNTQTAVPRGAVGMPTFFVGREIFLARTGWDRSRQLWSDRDRRPIATS